MSAKIKALRKQIDAEIEADPAARQWWSDMEAKMSLPGLKVGAWHDGLFPPASPTSKRRGRTAFAPQFMDAVCAILDAGTAGCIGEDFQAEIVTACKNADADFFLIMANAAAHVQEMPAPFPELSEHARKQWLSKLSEHARKVITLQNTAIKMMEMGGKPTKFRLRKIVAKYLTALNFQCDPISSTAWTLAFKDAGLGHLPLRPPAKKAAKVRAKTR